MKELRIESGDRGQRLTRFIQRRLPDAPSSFIYKMLRKKNITLNGKKASGSELLLEGDLVTFFLSDETISGFGGKIGACSNDAGGNEAALQLADEYVRAYRQLNGRIGAKGILYEDPDILAVRKPVGVLSQKASERDRSMNEWFVGYLIESGQIRPDQLTGFKPSICNRLDRNTGGILLCAKSLQGARKMAELLRDRSLRKYYQAAVAGTVRGSGRIKGYLAKDRDNNSVRFEKAGRKEQAGGEKGGWTETTYQVLAAGSAFSLLELELITGKTHQIRAHLASEGHPIVGDPKYGDMELNKQLRSGLGIRGQMLWCCRMEFPVIEDAQFSAISGKTILCDPPALYREIVGSTRKDLRRRQV